METERKWVVEGAVPGDVLARAGEAIDQGYLAVGESGEEVRLRRRNGRCTLTVKSGRGLERGEVETELSEAQFATLWPATSARRLEKTRRVVPLGDGLSLELDVYAGRLAGLRVVEVEFSDRDAAERFVAPDWFGREVTGDPAFSNQRLAATRNTPPDGLHR